MNTPAPDARPRLAAGVRLRLDRITGRYLLLRPEQGFELRGSALEIVRLCDGQATVAGIVDALIAQHDVATTDAIAADVDRLLGELATRGLVEWGPV